MKAMKKESPYGSGNPLYWAHVTGPTERRGSVRCARTAFEMVPVTTRRTPYENVMLIDIGTHPRLIPASSLQAMLPPGVHMTDLARSSMPALMEDALIEMRCQTGERMWTIPDTTTAFARYWNDEEAHDHSTKALEAQHRRIRVLAEGHGDLPVNAFPLPYEQILFLLGGGMTTIGDIFDTDLEGVRSVDGLNGEGIARVYRILEATLLARRIEIIEPLSVAAE